MTTPTEVNDFHNSDDLDTSEFAHHHSLGPDSTQAAAGNHEHLPKVLIGTAVITPSAADIPTSLAVSFPVGFFKDKPLVVISANTSVPGTTVRGVGATGPSQTGFTAWVTRTNTTPTGVTYVAVGR